MMATVKDGDSADVGHRWMERPFDPDERRWIREAMARFPEEKQEELLELMGLVGRIVWLWSLVGRMSLWACGVAGAVWAGREIIAKVLKAAFS